MKEKPYRHRQHSRRRVLRAVAVGSPGLALAGVIACTERGRPAALPVSESAQPKRGGTIARHGGQSAAFDTAGRTFDPHTEPQTSAITLRLVYQALLGYNLRTYEVEPDLAQSWEQPSPTEYLFKLAPNVKWQNKPPANGRAVTADDVVFSLNRLRSNEARFIHRSVIAAMDKVEALDKTTVRITTRKPDSSTLSALGGDPIVIMNPETVERARRFLSADEVVGSGAFIMKDIREGIAGEYVRNPDYFQPDLPYLDAIRTQFMVDDQAAYAAFLAGKLDIISRVPGEQVKNYIKNQGPGFKPDWFDHDGVRALMPHTEKRPFNDRRVTRALRLLMDHTEFITAFAEAYFGSGRYGSIFPAALSAWDVPQEEYSKRIFWRQPKDEAIREALALLNAAGYTRDNPLKFELSTLEGVTVRAGAELLQAQFRQNSQGVVQPSDLKLYDTPTWAAVRREGTFEYGFQGLLAALVEPGVWLNQVWRTGASRNYPRFSDPQVDALIDKQDATFNTNERKAIVREIVLYMMDNSPAVSCASIMNLNGLNPKVRRFAPEEFLNGRQYQWIWLDT